MAAFAGVLIANPGAVIRAVPAPDVRGAVAASGGEGAPGSLLPGAQSPCTVTHARQVAPLTVPLGAEIRVTSSLRVACRSARAPVHVVVVVDASEQMVDRGRNWLAPLLSDLESAVDDVNLPEHAGARLGVVSFRDRVATTEVQLTGTASDVKAGLHNIWVRNGLTCPQCGLREALRKARRMLQAGRGDGLPSPPREVILVASRGFEPVACDAVRAAASEVKPFGILVTTACGGGDCERRCLSEAATSLEYALEGGDWAYLSSLLSDIVQPAGAYHPVAALELRDRLVGLLAYVDGGAPDAVDGNTLGWTFQPWSGEVVTRSLRTRAVAVGQGYVSAGGEAVARYRPFAGGVVSETVPLANVAIHVLPVTPTVTSPTATPTATATATPGASFPPSPTASGTLPSTPSPTTAATPRSRLAFVPYAASGACSGEGRTLDLVLLVDVSGSMATADVSTFQNRWAAAGAIGQDLVRYHVFDGDRVAVIPFAEASEVRARLGDDRARVLEALSALPQWNGSRVDLGLAHALEEVRRGARERPHARAAIVLITDGDLNQTEAPELERQAAQVRAGHVRLLAVGLGRDADAAALARVTGSRGRVYVTDDLPPMAMAQAVGAALRCHR